MISGAPHRVKRLIRPLIVIMLVLVLLLFCSGTACAAEQADPATPEIGMSPIAFVLVLLFVCLVIGIVAPLGGVGGGVIFTPLMMGFTPIDSFIIRATGLFIAMAGSLLMARPYLHRGVANIKLLFFAGVPYSVSAAAGALMAGYVEATAGESGEALIRLVLGILVISIALLVLFGGKRVEYPEIKKVDGFSRRLSMGMSYWEASLDKIVNYQITRAPVGILLFCGVGLISGLFGMGAGWATVPVFNLVMLVPLKVAATSSSVLIGIGDTAAVWPYLIKGGIFPLFAVPCVTGMVLGSSIGSRIMLKARPSFVRWVIIVAMFGSGIKLIIDGVSRLGSI
jgi:uncharacterized membrane protein YfcA